MPPSSAPASPWKLVHASVQVSLTPLQLGNGGAAAREAVATAAFESLLLKYHRCLGGIVVARKGSIRFPGGRIRARIIDTSPFLHVTAKTELLLFAPQAGTVLSGVVKHVGPDHVGMSVMGGFHATLPMCDFTEGYVYVSEGGAGKWVVRGRGGSGDEVKLGTRIRFAVKLIDNHQGLSNIRSTLDAPGEDGLGIVGWEAEEDEVGETEETDAMDMDIDMDEEKDDWVPAVRKKSNAGSELLLESIDAFDDDFGAASQMADVLAGPAPSVEKPKKIKPLKTIQKKKKKKQKKEMLEKGVKSSVELSVKSGKDVPSKSSKEVSPKSSKKKKKKAPKSSQGEKETVAEKEIVEAVEEKTPAVGKVQTPKSSKKKRMKAAQEKAIAEVTPSDAEELKMPKHVNEEKKTTPMSGHENIALTTEELMTKAAEAVAPTVDEGKTGKSKKNKTPKSSKKKSKSKEGKTPKAKDEDALLENEASAAVSGGELTPVVTKGAPAKVSEEVLALSSLEMSPKGEGAVTPMADVTKTPKTKKKKKTPKSSKTKAEDTPKASVERTPKSAGDEKMTKSIKKKLKKKKTPKSGKKKTLTPAEENKQEPKVEQVMEH